MGMVAVFGMVTHNFTEMAHFCFNPPLWDTRNLLSYVNKFANDSISKLIRPGKCDSKLKSIIFKLIIQYVAMGNRWEFALMCI